MARPPFLLTAVTLVACWACDVLAPNEDIGPLTFELGEVDYFGSPGTGPQIVLFLATEQQYPCMNYQLESELAIQADKVHIDVSGRVTIGEICLTAIGPAQFRAVLPIAEGTYALEFTRAGLTDRYTLTVTETAIEIATREAHFTRPIAESFPRVS
jgi:hypothetical protein